MRFTKVLLWQVRLFPASYRATRSDELEDALAGSRFTVRSAARESFALFGAAITAWRKHLLTREGIKNSLFFGTASWFAFLVALGPIDRLVSLRQGELSRFVIDQDFSVAAIGLLCLAYVALFWHRAFALVLGIAGVVFAALSIRVGDWQLLQSLPYEFRWIGLPLLASILLRGKRAMHWSTALLGAVPAVVLLLLPLRDTPRGTGYGWTLQRLDSPGLGATVDVFVGLQWMDIAILFLIVVFALGPWLFPSGIAAALPAMVNVTLLAPEPAPVLLIAYLAAAIYARTRLVRVKADLGWEESAAPTSE